MHNFEYLKERPGQEYPQSKSVYGNSEDYGTGKAGFCYADVEMV